MRPYTVAVSASVYIRLNWLCKAMNLANTNPMEKDTTVDALADKLIGDYLDRTMPQLGVRWKLRQEIEEAAVAEAAQTLSPVASQPTNQSLLVAHNAHLAAGVDEYEGEK